MAPHRPEGIETLSVTCGGDRVFFIYHSCDLVMAVATMGVFAAACRAAERAEPLPRQYAMCG